jgi:hypothetical protein
MHRLGSTSNQNVIKMKDTTAALIILGTSTLFPVWTVLLSPSRPMFRLPMFGIEGGNHKQYK